LVEDGTLDESDEPWTVLRRAQIAAPAGAQVVQDDHVTAGPQQGVDHVRADEPRSAGDDDPHDLPFR